MAYIIAENIIIFFLTILGIFFSEFPIYFVMSAAFLLIVTNYNSFCDEVTVKARILELTLKLLYAVLSFNITGYICIFFDRKNSPYIRRIVIGLVSFAFFDGVIYKNESPARIIVYTFILLIIYLVMVGISYLVKREKERSELEERRTKSIIISELHEKRLNEQLLKQRVSDERNARLLERENISRNIHNSVGHSITAAIMTLDAADMLYEVKPDEARKKMNDANERIRGSLESIRQAVRMLDEENKELTVKDLKAELDLIVSDFVMDTSIVVTSDYSEADDNINIPHDHAVFLTGVLKEMLTNGLKHGNASEYRVVLLGDSAHIRLVVMDNGQSDFNITNKEYKIENGFGLKKIISYVERHGGKTTFDNEDGFKSMIELPI